MSWSNRCGRRARRAAVSFVAGALVLAACGGGGSGGESTANTGTDGAAGGATDPDAELNATYYIAPLSLDPHQESSSGQRPYWAPGYDTLFDITAGSPEPMIATDAEFSADGLTVTLPLRDDVVFSDGTLLDADAVVASIERAKNEGVANVANQLEAVSGVSAVDPTTVQLTLSAPTPYITAILGGPAGAIVNPAVAADPAADLNTQTAGSGAYQSADYVPESHVVYERSDQDYWDERGGLLASLTVSYVADQQTALNGLQSGQYDAVWSVGGIDRLEPIAASGDFEIHDMPAQGADSIYLRTSREYLGDVRVRQALAYALDREAIAEGVYRGDCVATSQTAPEGHPFHLDEEPYSFDPDRARELLEEAGVTGMDLNVVDIGTTSAHDLALASQQYFQDIGLNVTVTPGQADAAPSFARGEMDTLVTNNPMRAHPLQRFYEAYLPQSSLKLANDDPAELEALVAEASDPSLSEDELADVYHEIGELLAELSLTIPVCVPLNHIVARSDVVNAELPQPSNPNYRLLGVEAD